MPIASTLTPLGFFVQAPAALGPPSPLLADDIDPQTRDFRSMTVGADPIDEQVQTAMSTIRGSGASVTDDGISPSPRKMGPGYQDRIKGDARLALQRLVRNGDIRIKAVEIDLDDQTNQQAQVRVVYYNLRAMLERPREVAVPVPGSVQA